MNENENLFRQKLSEQKLQNKGLGLLVMGDNSYSRGHGFESRRHKLDGDEIFSH